MVSSQFDYLSSVTETYSFPEIWNSYCLARQLILSFAPIEVMPLFDFRWYLKVTSKISTNAFRIDYNPVFNTYLPNPSPLENPIPWHLFFQGIELDQLDPQLNPPPVAYQAMSIFRHSTLINHSCDPNVDFKVQLNSDNDSPISLSFHSLKKIKKDDQLFTSYLPSPKMKYDQRQKYLLDNWGFVCQCKKCITESQKKNLN